MFLDYCVQSLQYQNFVLGALFNSRHGKCDQRRQASHEIESWSMRSLVHTSHFHWGFSIFFCSTCWRLFLTSLSKYRRMQDMSTLTSTQTAVMLSGIVSTASSPRGDAIAEFLSLFDTTQSNKSLSLDVGFSCLKGTTVCNLLRLRLNPMALCLMLPLGRPRF